MTSIKHKLIVAFTIITLILSVLYGLLIFKAMEWLEDDILTKRLYMEYQDYVISRNSPAFDGALPQTAGLHSYLSSSADLPDWLRSIPVGFDEVSDKEVHVGVFSLPDSDQKLYLVLDEIESSNLDNKAFSIASILIVFGVVITLFGLLFGLFLSRQISQPIQLLTTDIVKQPEQQNLTFFGHQREDEIGALSRSFGDLVSRLDSFIQREKQFTQYVSHEFRTPITLLKTSLANLALTDQTPSRHEKNLQRIANAAQEMDVLVNTFLNLSREQIQLEEQRITIVPLLEAKLQRNKDVFHSKQLDVQLTVQHELVINSDNTLLSILIDNVIRNIFVHAGAKANITVLDNSVLFENTLPEQYSSNENRDSHGLDIINQLAKLLGIDVSTSHSQQGYCLTLSF